MGKELLILTILAFAIFFMLDDGQSDQLQPIDSQKFRTSNDTIIIASFNIQIFGRTKLSNPDVVEDLHNIISRFDIVAIQEIRDNTEQTIPMYVKDMNQYYDENYLYIVSDRFGRTSSKEQYAFIWDPDRVDLLDFNYYRDINDTFERDPYAAYFNASGYEFVLVTIHTKPNNARKEIQALPQMFGYFENVFGEEDVIILGDFNADGQYFSEDTITGLRSDDYIWVIQDDIDTTVSDSNNYTYDRIVFQREYTKTDFSGEAGVFKFDKYPLNSEDPSLISDHYPVYAIFNLDGE